MPEQEHRATLCAWCWKVLDPGFRPARYGVCPACEAFVGGHEQAKIARHNELLDDHDRAEEEEGSP